MPHKPPATRLLKDVRESMTTSSDPRAARTREAIIAATHELTSSSQEALTVSAIASKAGISRSSFYAQFANFDELGLALMRVALAEIAVDADLFNPATRVSPEVARAAIGRLVAHVDENRRLYRSVLDLPLSYGVYREAVAVLEEQLVQVLPQAPNRDRHVPISVAASYVASGTIAVLSTWLGERAADSREDVTRQLVSLLPAWVVDPTGLSPHVTTATRNRRALPRNSG